MKNLLLTLCIILLFSSNSYARTNNSLSMVTYISPVQNNNPLSSNNNSIQISGTITYSRPKLNKNHIGFNPNGKKTNPARQIVIRLLDEKRNIITTTTTDDQGRYNFPYISKNREVRVSAYALMENNQSGNSWRINVVDNTRGDALYSSEGDLSNTKESDNLRDLHIPLKDLKSAPFSIIDDIYSTMKKMMDIEPVRFPPLSINWSLNNISINGSFKDGHIATSFFDGDKSIYLLGDQHLDSDEFDTHVIIHEWGHYFEHHFSRADSMGGLHGEGDKLDIRVAFGEGFGNAWSAIVTDNPIYTDTSGRRGWFMNIEKGETIDKGWWSESSIQKIIYDLYDDKNESHDQISLGIEPIYRVLTNEQKTTKAFSSIFSFITAIKKRNPILNSKIDKLLSDENINSINNDIYGEAHHSLYSDLGEDNICTSSKHGVYNKLLNHKYVRFTIDTQKIYTIQVKQINEDNSDPDFSLYGGEPFRFRKSVETFQKSIESSSIFLPKGDYILDISDYNNLREACFWVDVE